MYIREKPNKSGIISVQIVDKSSGKDKVVKTIGNSSIRQDADALIHQGKQWIKKYNGQLDFDNEKQLLTKFKSGIQEITVAGAELLLGKIFDQNGFNQIQEDLFRQLVLARLCFPLSKLKTIDYLHKYFSIEVDENKVYRYLDKLYNNQKEKV